MSADKKVRLDPTNAVIVSKADGKITRNGIHPRCPHCGAALLHNHRNFLCTTVGSQHKNECGYCRNQYQTLELTVPVDTTTEEFYEKIRKALFEEG